MVCYQCVNHGQHSDAGEEERRDKGDSVTEVEHTNGKGAEDDGEVKPRQESSFVGEEDLGLNTSWQGDALT
jgi:hypothetical protein